MVDRFHSRPLELPDPEHPLSRADLAFYDVDHSRASFEVRVFLGARRGLSRDAGADEPSYAGSFFVFGHERCHGDEGHCEVPSGRDPYDFRLPHHLEPGVQIVTVTDAVRRLLEAGKRKASVDAIAHMPEGNPVKVLSFSHIRLLTYD